MQFPRAVLLFCLTLSSSIVPLVLAPCRTLGAEPSADRPLTLKAAVDYALAHSPRLASARQGVATEEYDVAAAKAERWPRFETDASYRFSDTPTQTALQVPLSPLSDVFAGQPSSQQQLSAGAFATVPIYLGGRIRAATHLAEAKRELSQISVRDVQRQLIFDVTASYARTFQLDSDVQAAQESVQALQEARRDAKHMLDVGKVARVDLLKVDAGLADVQDELSEFSDARDAEASRLNALIGRPVLTTVAMEDKLPQPQATVEVQDAIRAALEDNPKYQEEQQRVAVAERTAQLTGTALNPSVSIVGGYFVNSPSPFATSGETPLVGVVASFPFFDHRVTERVKQNLSEAEEHRDELRQVAFDIGQRVQAAYLAIKDAQARIESTTSAVGWAREALRIELLKERLGRETIEHLLDAQAALLTTEANYNQSLADYTTAVAALERETGTDYFGFGVTK
jgi:outer membrane protein TolC